MHRLAHQLLLAAQVIVAPPEHEIPQDIFGKSARVICTTYQRVYEAGKPRIPFVRCHVVRGRAP